MNCKQASNFQRNGTDGRVAGEGEGLIVIGKENKRMILSDSKSCLFVEQGGASWTWTPIHSLTAAAIFPAEQTLPNQTPEAVEVGVGSGNSKSKV